MPAAVPRITLACLTCAAPFQRRPQELTRHLNSGRYCSSRCRGLGMRHRALMECAQCHCTFERCAAEAARSNPEGVQAFCSPSCMRAYRGERRISYPKIGSRHAHRLEGEKIAGRPLLSSEVVHHRNEDKQDFSRDNLEVMPRGEHSRLHYRVAARDRLPNGRFIKQSVQS